MKSKVFKTRFEVPASDLPKLDELVRLKNVELGHAFGRQLTRQDVIMLYGMCWTLELAQTQKIAAASAAAPVTDYVCKFA